MSGRVRSKPSGYMNSLRHSSVVLFVQVFFSAYQASCRVSSVSAFETRTMSSFNGLMMCLEADMKTAEQKAQRKKAKRERQKEREMQHKKEFFALKANQYH